MLSLTSPQPLVTIGGMSLIEFLTLHASRRLLQPFRKLVVAHETIVDGADYMPKVNRIGAWFHGFMLGLHHSKGLNPQRKNPQVGPEPYDDPYDNDQGDWLDTAEPEEHKMFVVVAPRLGHPPGTG